MNKITMAIIMGLALISLASALTYNLTAGEPYTLNLNETFDYYSIVGNSTPITLTITQDEDNITILSDKYSPTDSFELVFFNKEKEIITKHHYSHGRTRYIDRNITVEKEVPEYVDREVIKEVPGEPEIIEKIPKGVYWIISSLMFLCIGLIILYLIKRKKEVKE